MESSQDIRWKQRFSNYQKALSQLKEFIDKRNLSKLETQGLLKSFEYTYELAWNTMKDFYESQGESNIQGSRNAIRLAFKRGLILDGENWMNMIQVGLIPLTHIAKKKPTKWQKKFSILITNSLLNLKIASTKYE